MRASKVLQIPNQKEYEPVLNVDGANGIGAMKLFSLQTYLGHRLKINVFNSGEGRLNEKVRK